MPYNWDNQHPYHVDIHKTSQGSSLCTYNRPVARTFRRGATRMSDVDVCQGVWGHAPPGNAQKLDGLRLLLRPFWDRSRAEVAIWLMVVLHPNLAVTKPADFEFPREKVLKVVRRAGEVTTIEEKLVNSQAPEIVIYLRIYLHAFFLCSGVNSFTCVLRACPP